MKRKQRSPRLAFEMDDDDDDDEPRDGPPSKRRRCNALENGLAHLTLNSPQREHSTASGIWGQATPPSVEEVLASSSACPVNPFPPAQFQLPPDAALPDIVLPDSVEEPSVPEVDMRASTWYEPEPNRIIITDLDGFVESDEEGDPPSKDFQVHPGFLEQIRSKKLNNHVSPTAKSSQALILFRPPPSLPASIKENEPSPTPLADEYAMDLDG
ncbi:hypothetical protein BKA70DRAFT_1420903 [Coprinopsis sp. MPI-PUGE-AT-0042]|nr:hypothetical protein BKA70DRAFT_1420903 [Coprinopsis sp. MPI-PUGE-AT-0042]